MSIKMSFDEEREIVFHGETILTVFKIAKSTLRATFSIFLPHFSFTNFQIKICQLRIFARK